MKVIFLLISVGLFLMGVTYLYKPKRIIKINNWLRNTLFNDSLVILYRKKIGIICIVVSVITFYAVFYVHRIFQTRNLTTYSVWSTYYQQDYDRAEAMCLEILKKEPNNITCFKQLALIYFVKGNYRKSEYYCKKLLDIQPENKKIQVIYNEITKKKFGR